MIDGGRRGDPYLVGRHPCGGGESYGGCLQDLVSASLLAEPWSVLMCPRSRGLSKEFYNGEQYSFPFPSQKIGRGHAPKKRPATGKTITEAIGKNMRARVRRENLEYVENTTLACCLMTMQEVKWRCGSAGRTFGILRIDSTGRGDQAERRLNRFWQPPQVPTCMAKLR